MAIGSQQYTVGTNAVLIAEGDATGSVWVVNGGNATVFLGGVNVSATNGLQIDKQSAPIQVTLHVGDRLYAVTSAATATVSVLQT